MMIPGAFAGAWCFDDFRRHFEAAGWRVLTPELRHHGAPGGADPRLAGTGLRDYADDLAAEIGALDEAPVLLGHSMGGLLAQLLAARGLARAAVLLAPAPSWGILPSSREEIAAAMGLMSLGSFWEQVLDSAFEIAADNSLNCLPADRQRAVFERFVPESGQALFECLFWMFDPNRAAYVNGVNVDCPLLCIAGGRDRVVVPDSVRKTADKYPELATFMEFEEMGHMLLLEDDWQAVAEACTDWLAAVL
ncbi:MAG: alpha/beta hydrolase [Alphaproteobacteria bacterium]|nr:alpha/beta hydrolase [Alphaproteobacteria bacterium]